MRLSDVVLVILFLITMIFVFWYILGDSPTFEQAILVVAVTAIITFAVKIGQHDPRLDYHDKRFDRLERSVREGFRRVREDMELIKAKLGV